MMLEDTAEIDTADILKRIVKIAECIFNEKITTALPNMYYSQCYTIHKNDTEIASVIKYYNGLYVLIPKFKDNIEFIKAVTLALPDIEIRGVLWTP